MRALTSEWMQLLGSTIERYCMLPSCAELLPRFIPLRGLLRARPAVELEELRMSAKNHDVEKERYWQRTIAEAAWSDYDSDDRPKTDGMKSDR